MRVSVLRSMFSEPCVETGDLEAEMTVVELADGPAPNADTAEMWSTSARAAGMTPFSTVTERRAASAGELIGVVKVEALSLREQLLIFHEAA